jgi:peptide deformylase
MSSASSGLLARLKGALASSLQEEVDPGVVAGTDLRIVKYPDPRLRAPNAEVGPGEFTPELQKLAKDMFKVMYAANGVGLAAPQVGVNKRLMVFNPGESVRLFVGVDWLGLIGCGLTARDPTS